MDERIDIFWPKRTALNIWEVEVSYEFCRKTSRQLCEPVCGVNWADYPEDMNIRQVLDGAGSDLILIVTDPEIVFSGHALDSLRQAVSSGLKVCGPVYNSTGNPSQVAELATSPYLNVTGYVEMSRRISESESGYILSGQPLDPSCILYRRDFLTALSRMDGNDRLLLSQVSESIPASEAAVAPGSLVHRFGDYYRSERLDLIRLIPDGVRSILDIGCAMGGYGRSLKQVRPEVRITGVELNAVMAGMAAEHYDRVITSPVEQANIDEKFDLVNCGDLLEHMENPWQILGLIRGLLGAEGYLVLSVPNAGNWTIIKDLLKGKFEYIPVGLLCVSHLRWFTEMSIRQALADAGFEMDVFERQQIPATPDGHQFIADMVASGYGDEISLRTNEFIIRAVKR